ncbi:MAG TPA: FtsX-like permease family protein [Solirubrobacteraceae bacterium]|nr:FtsX-like permease family protein [Solirubrobacteraceae bacterium]
MRFKSWSSIGQELLAVLGIAVGVALLFASQVASQSLDGSVRQLAGQLVAGTQYQLDGRSSEGFSEAIANEVRAVPGVRAALPLIEQSATVIGPRGRASVDLIGADPRFARLGGPLLRRFSARQLAHQRAIGLPSQIAREIGVQAFQTANLQVRGVDRETFIGATLTGAEVGKLADSQIALAPLSYAQSVTGNAGRITRVFVKVQPDQDHAAQSGLSRIAATHHLNLVPADNDATLFSVAFGPAEQSEGLFSLISAMVAFLFAFTAMLLTVPARRRLIELMRAQGYERGDVIQVMLVDAFVIGVLACGLGIGIGEILSVAVFRAEPGYLAFAFPVGSPRIVTPLAVIEAVTAGMLAAFAGVIAPVRHIIALPLRSFDELEARGRGLGILRVVVGVLCVATTTAVLIFRPSAALGGSIALVIAMLALLPLLFDASISAVRRTLRPFGATPARVAVSGLRASLTRTRSLAVAATGAIAVFGSVAISGAQHNLEHGLDRTAHEWNMLADVWVTPPGEANTLGTTAFPSEIANRLTRVSGVRNVGLYRGSFLDLGHRRVWVIAPPQSARGPLPSGQITVGNIQKANARLRTGGWAIISEAIAAEKHLHIGDAFNLPSPQPTTFRVAGLSTNGGWPPGAIVLNSKDYARAWQSTAASALTINVAPGYSPLTVKGGVARALGPRSGLAVQTASEREAEWTRISHHGLARLTEIAHLVLGAAIIAMAGVIASMIWQRRERIANMREQGFSRLEGWMVLLLESLILLFTGCSIGAVFGLYGQLLLSHALTAVTDFPLVVGLGPVIALTRVAIVSASALAIVAVPGYFAARVGATMVKPA